MSKVEMSLQEYNNLKEKLDHYERILNAIVTPTVSDWDIKYYKEHPNHRISLSCNPKETLSAIDYDYLLNMMTQKACNLSDSNSEIAELGAEYDPDPTFTIGYLKRFEEESEEG